MTPAENRVVDYNLAPHFAVINLMGAKLSSKAVQKQAAKVRAGVTPTPMQMAQFPSMDMPFLPV